MINPDFQAALGGGPPRPGGPPEPLSHSRTGVSGFRAVTRSTSTVV